jgi:hypothetical protein
MLQQGRLPRPEEAGALSNYRGFLFGSLNADVPPIEQYLGEPRASST